MVMSFLSNSLLYSSLVDDTSSLTVKISFQNYWISDMAHTFSSGKICQYTLYDHNQSIVAILNNAE